MSITESMAILVVLTGTMALEAGTPSVVAPGAQVQKPAGGFEFTEGPAADAQGNLYFTDVPTSRIYKWSLEGKLTTFLENTGGANGLFFDKSGNLIACQGDNRQIVSISPDRKIIVLADKYDGKRFNSPNDLWIDPNTGGIYFTDPRYGNRDGMEQGGEYVYYLTPDRQRVIRVVEDMTRPNGLIGTADGRKLYIADQGAGRTFVYTINKDGTLADKKLFAPEGSDGMTIDNEGHVYLTTDTVVVYDRDGQKVEEIKVPEPPSNVSFGGKDRKVLYITARTSLYSVVMRVRGVREAVMTK